MIDDQAGSLAGTGSTPQKPIGLGGGMEERLFRIWVIYFAEIDDKAAQCR